MAEPIALITKVIEAQPFAPACALEGNAFLRLLNHHVYEYGRGVRALFLMTLTHGELTSAVERLQRLGVDHFVQNVCPAKANLFFGRAAFVDVARALATRPLNLLTPEEDFMLGALLGYDREQQCLRYLARRQSVALATAAE
ncbi:Protein of unknown function [Rhodoblastus acidophilus]|uniref:DUF2023 domain-containing protein n=1 Tax=Rhodoblastus acidophilus TaxID=1074 RepID=A0A212S8P8_RHOAC|nr:DUF2023 family protein [Rhodoblastus acidophilus]PPQ36815.1 DUF2023 domain-containing protein [Rhodoblastus acidophilus]RAI21399.1 DUF2023 domain-containing protein [Rhodoblastus acidophilus]SNB81612.1 Protein of unknown function [Rhodoblastus acidophilus]